LALVSPGPLSATKRKSVLLPQTSYVVRDWLLPSTRTRLHLAEHEGDILLHKAAKKAFDELGVKKAALRQELAGGIRQAAIGEKGGVCRIPAFVRRDARAAAPQAERGSYAGQKRARGGEEKGA